MVTYEQLLEEAKREREDSLKTEEVSSNQLAIVLYTSGSTGIPKGNATLFCHLFFLKKVSQLNRQTTTHTFRHYFFNDVAISFRNAKRLIATLFIH